MSSSGVTYVPTRRAAVAPPASAGGLRVGDDDRGQAYAVLGQAVAFGYLSLAELDERLDRVGAATNTGELAAVTADLPVAELRRRDPARRAARVALARRGVVIHLAAYLAVTVLLVVIWLAVAVTTGGWYPWPIWPALGGVVGVAAHALPVRAASRRR